MRREITGRNGALTQYIISDATEAQIAQIQEIATYYPTIDGSTVRGDANKKQIASFRRMSETSQQSTVAASISSKSIKRIVSAEYADENNLNHGRVWTCNERNIETQGVSPEMEGSLICYVYAN